MLVALCHLYVRLEAVGQLDAVGGENICVVCVFHPTEDELVWLGGEGL